MNTYQREPILLIYSVNYNIKSTPKNYPNQILTLLSIIITYHFAFGFSRNAGLRPLQEMTTTTNVGYCFRPFILYRSTTSIVLPSTSIVPTFFYLAELRSEYNCNLEELEKKTL